MTTEAKVNLADHTDAARAATRELARASAEQKNRFLETLAGLLEQRSGEISEANEKDVAAARAAGLGEHIVDRLLLDQARTHAMAAGVRGVAALEDPVGEVLESRELPNGLDLRRVRVPIGVIGVIYESRPNVTIDIAALCLKSGNAVVMRGGKEAFNSNTVLADTAREALESAGLPPDALQFIPSTDRDVIDQMLRAKGMIDLLIPRGGEALIRRVREDSRVPAITGGIGVCHTYVDRAADIEKAVSIIENAKTQRPSVCNALDTVLVHSGIAPSLLGPLGKSLASAGVELRCDQRSMSILEPALGADAKLKPASPEDFGQEFLDLVASIKIVDSYEEAVRHIVEYGSGHSEAIVSEDPEACERFLNEVDAAAVFANASTRFHDGGEFGLGAEIAVSTDRLHARGPMGLKEITSYKWVVRGNGQVRA